MKGLSSRREVIMAYFKDIAGHEDTILHLKNAIHLNRVSHAYLITGPEGSGKRMLADAFAKTLECENGREDACGQCHSCHQAESGNHPDIIHVTHEKPNTISVQDIRSQIVGDIQVTPYNEKYKIYIVPEAEKMNQQAQNALLKTLEEPPEYAVILLLTVNGDQLLETIRSRCVTLPLRPVADKVVEEYLMSKKGVPDYNARLCAAFAQGSIGKAIKLAQSEYFGEIRQNAVTLVRRAAEMDVAELVAYAKSMEAYKLDIAEFLNLLMVWYRDELYFKATRDADTLVFRDQLQLIRELARKSSYEGIETILQAIEKAKVRLRANVSYALTLELLFLTIKEN